MAQNITRIAEALVYIDNEALKLKAEGKVVGQDSEAFSKIELEKRKLYSLKGYVLNILSKKKLLFVMGHKVQYVNDRKNKIYFLKLKGDDTETIITNLKSFTKNKRHRNRVLGEIGLMEHKELDTDFNLETAVKFLDDYVQEYYLNRSKNTKTPVYSIRETKLVDIAKLRIVKDIHRKTNMNPKKYEEKKAEIVKLLEDNKGKYPKSEALIVKKAKDPEDKRRVIYELEDGLRRLVIAQELGLEKVYVGIIE